MEFIFFLNQTLIVIVGDHGMSEVGSHGGATKAETTVPMVFLSDRFKHAGIPKQSVPNAAQQIDLSPSLSAMFGVPIPRNGLGVILPALFSVFESAADRLAWARWNLDQLAAVLESNFGLGSESR